MAAAHEPGILRVYYTRGPKRELVFQSPSTICAPSSGAATDPRLYQQVPISPKALGGDGLLEFTYESAALDIIDSTDSSASIPVVVDGRNIQLDLDDMDAGDVRTKYQDQQLVANAEVKIGEYRVPTGSVLHFGGGPLYWNVFDDTA